MSVVVLLPMELAKSRNREISILEPATVRRVRDFPKKLFLALLLLSGIPAIVLYWPIGLAALIVDLYCWLSVILIVYKSHSGKAFDVACPNCDKINRHWSNQGFICTDCRHLLMRHGGRVYDITSKDVQALLDDVSLNTKPARVAGRAKLFS